ncbi:hypothetical protein BDR04DRAFT_1123567, partial [Suillus decipiens]
MARTTTLGHRPLTLARAASLAPSVVSPSVIKVSSSTGGDGNFGAGAIRGSRVIISNEGEDSGADSGGAGPSTRGGCTGGIQATGGVGVGGSFWHSKVASRPPSSAEVGGRPLMRNFGVVLQHKGDLNAILGVIIKGDDKFVIANWGVNSGRGEGESDSGTIHVWHGKAAITKCAKEWGRTEHGHNGSLA